AVVREIRNDFTEAADKHGIGVFADNLTNLLLSPPIKKTRILGVDPGIRTGTKAACLDENGKFLAYFMFYQEKKEDSMRAIAEHVNKYNLELIAVGNGTGSRDVQLVVSEAISRYNLPVQYAVVSEDGASVYSASDIAREEFPDLDLTIRGAISIGRRLLDPLSELVKIDPKSIGVGLYQHDVNQTELSKSLDEVVESVVNRVGVNVNTASFSLLKYASGINTFVAKNIVEYRDDFGTIKSREDLKKISGFGEKTFEQAAGFLKIPESSDPLDNTWVHPENYDVAREILEILKAAKGVAQAEKQKLAKKYDIGEQTITDIIEELKKPNRDPRDNFPKPIMQKGVVNFEDLKVGMKVTGQVKNVVDFGAFVDIGIKETGLIHVSEMADKFIKDPKEAVKVGDVKEFKIIEIDTVRKRISLSLKEKKKFNMNDYIIN
ncbi:MAG TPA: helix-hairpin-helix domain-containing protein, partial [Spirochaetota bacterium]|nr:helix-hairpin-helix domain-containing protein [Spirochaetota bacterium]